MHLITELARTLALAALLLSSVLCPPSSASQNQLSSPTTGTVSGLQLTNNYNNALDSLNTGNSGASAPTNQLSGIPSLGNVWLNTTGIPYPVQWYDGSNWLTPFWIDATNHVTNVKIGGGTATVASASTVDLCAAAGNVAPRAYITITGSTTIISFGSTCNAGHVKFVTFAGTLTLTYNATSLIIPGAQNVTTSAGDQAVLMALGSGNWQVAFYQPANGAALVNPAVDLGTYLFTSAVSPPSSKYLFAYGQAISRTTYANLMAVQTITQSVTRTNGSPTLTGFSDTTQIGAGACVEGSGIPNSGSCTTTILSCTSTTCTMSGNASSSGTANVTIFPNGNGDGSTTFNLPDCQGTVLAGRDNMSGTPAARLTSTYFGSNPDALGTGGGSQSNALSSTNQLPRFTPSGSISGSVSATSPFANGLTVGQAGTGIAPTSSSGNPIVNVVGANMTFSGSFTGNAIGSNSPSAFATTPPTRIANCMIRVLSKLVVPPYSSLAANDNLRDMLAVSERRRPAA
jgi:hypothetical protein